MRSFSVQCLQLVAALFSTQVHAFWNTDPSDNLGGGLRTKSSRSVLPELDEFVHGATSLPSFAFDQLMAEYSDLRAQKVSKKEAG